MDGDEQNCYLDIWEDHLSMKLLTGGSLDINACTLVDIESAKKKSDEVSLVRGYIIFLEPNGS